MEESSNFHSRDQRILISFHGGCIVGNAIVWNKPRRACKRSRRAPWNRTLFNRNNYRFFAYYYDGTLSTIIFLRKTIHKWPIDRQQTNSVAGKLPTSIITPPPPPLMRGGQTSRPETDNRSIPCTTFRKSLSVWNYSAEVLLPSPGRMQHYAMCLRILHLIPLIDSPNRHALI